MTVTLPSRQASVDVAGDEFEAEPADVVSADGGRSHRPPLVRIVGGAAAFVFLCLGVWFIVRDKDGNETARIYLPDGGSGHVESVPAATSTAKDATPPAPPPAASNLPASALALFQSLASTKPLFVDEFDGPTGAMPVRPRSPNSDGGFSELGYADGRWYSEQTRPEATNWVFVANPNALPRGLTDFVCLVVARGLKEDNWGVFFVNRMQKNRLQSFGLDLFRKGNYQIAPEWHTHTGPKLPTAFSSAIRPLDEWNTLTFVVWDKKLWLFINGEPVESAMSLGDVEFPVDIDLRWSGGKEIRVEYERVAVWGPEAIPAALKNSRR
jgi:hypothetical protein